MPKQNKSASTPKSTDAHHHQHLRKRLTISKKFKIGFVDKLVYVAGPLIPIAIAPTAYHVWANDQVQGLVLPTWSILLFTSFSMSLYAVVHKARPLVLTYVPLTLLNAAVVVGILVKS